MKRIQRACDACARRKIRCDRQRPCHPCLQRNIGRLCSNYVQAVQTKSSVIAEPLIEDATLDNAKQVRLLRERLALLEERLAQSQNPLNEYGSLNLGGHHTDHRSPAQLQPLQDLDELQSAIENLNLGLDESEVTPTTLGPTLQRIEHDIQGVLPSYRTSKAIVQHSLMNLGWIHCALRASIFMQEHEKFWESIQTVNAEQDHRPTWLALYFAVLSTGLYFMDINHDCFKAFSYHETRGSLQVPQTPTDAMVLSRVWYKTSLSELDRSDFMGRARLNVVQTIAVLTLVNNSFGENEREWLMMGAAINMCRSLHMHVLGSETRTESSVSKLPQWKAAEDRALGRRLWWTLVICDWLGSMNRFPNIHPDSFDSCLEPNPVSEDVVLNPSDIFDLESESISCLIYHEVIAGLANVLRAYVKAGRGSSESNLISAMFEIEKISSGLPTHLSRNEIQSPSTMTRDTLHPWIPMQRYLLTHVIQFMRLTIARAYFDQWLRRQPDKQGFHGKAIEAAEIIVSEKLRNLPSMFQKSWIICASTVAAGVFLGLDLLCFGTGEGETHAATRRSSIQVCIRALEALGSSNVISRRGPTVLRRLLALDAAWDYKSVPTGEKLHSIVEFISEHDENVAQQESIAAHLKHLTKANNSVQGVDFFDTSIGAFNSGNSDPIDEILSNTVTEDVDFEMEMFENPFDFSDSMM